MTSSKRIIFIVGPTGVGKSEAGFLLAQKLGAEIVSCDSMQVYREVNIACDKPLLEQRRVVPHHLLDVASVAEEFDVVRFRDLAIVAINDITNRKKVALVVGGSGMYMSVLLDGIFETDTEDEDLRAGLFKKAETQGPSVLYEQLSTLDPQAAAKIHANDTRRLVRALEVTILTGQPISQLQPKRTGLWDQRDKYEITLFAFDRPRAELYQRVERRIDRMFETGLIEEVRTLIAMPLGRTAATLIGIPEVRGYWEGQYDLERAKYLLKLNTRHFVKRQLTWFRRDKRLQWFDISEQLTIEDVVKRLGKFLKT